ncbi:hypothetical protein [Flexibacterium corallicola]|uniref:hypothetical protein n=1 Tax=Flexibacterium corallicola TaxID=3037259 RepID=UPI00286F7997|nr:hypothetical protein [Pseudovibrio sp. M1P-2-3]
MTVVKKTNMESIFAQKTRLTKLLTRTPRNDEDPLPIPPAVIDPENKLPGVTYSIFQMNDAPEELKEEVEIGKELTEKFLSLAGAIVQNEADFRGDPSYVQKEEGWRDAFGFFTDFFTINTNGNRNLKLETAGTRVARKTLDFACNVIAAEIGDFQTYLQGVADVLSDEAKETEQSQTMLYNFCQHNLFENSSGVIFYLPQISFAHTHFSLKESKHLGVCSESHEVKMDLVLNQMIMTFAIKSYMNDTLFREQCNDFIENFRTKSIEKKKTTLQERLNRVKPAPEQKKLLRAA